MQGAQFGDRPANRRNQHLGRLCAARLGQYHHPIGRAGVARCKGDDTPAADTRDVVDRPFNVLRVVLAAINHDDVLDSTTDEQLAAAHVPEVAGMEPALPNRGRC